MMQSIKTRLSAGLVASLMGIFVLQWYAVAVAVRQMSETRMAAHMGHDIEGLLSALSLDANGKLRLDNARIEKVFLTPFSGSYFRIQSGESAYRSRSLWDQDLPAEAIPPGHAAQRRIRGPQSQSLLVVTRSFLLRGRTVTISVADDLTPLEQDLARFRNRYALLSVGLLTLLLVLQGAMVHAGLAPLRRLRADLQRLDRGEIATLDGKTPSELRPLVDELNRLLSVLRSRLTRSRQSLGNLAHALKAPLTILTDLGNQASLKKIPEVREPLVSQTAKLNILIERELTRARLAGTAAPATRFDVAAELPPLLDTLQSIYRGKALTIEPDVEPDLSLNADREDMLELLGNLLDNACKWGRKRIRLDISGSQADVRIQIEDDGPGCPPAEVAKLAQRGIRLDENMPGHGLGLTIVRDIVEGYGGRLAFGSSETLGGLRVRVDLPVLMSRGGQS